MKIITVHCTAKAGSHNALKALCTSMIGPSRRENGCIQYSFYQDQHDDNRFLFYEEWTDQAAIDKHNTTKHFSDFQPEFKKLIEGEPVIRIYSVE